jgi:class 3 adenylate cyclase/tetratricopeptide (TPR) repeat protein
MRCRGCGADNGLRAKFCSECGKPMPQSGAGGIVRDLSERKFLTILFADIRNSTDMIQALDPEDAMAKLRPVIDLMVAAVREAGGMVNRIQGDGIMALFGAPVAVDDHALRACHAALLMRNRVAELADRDISIRIGVHSGEVVAHIDAGDFSHAYDVTGQAAHFAARLEQAAEAGVALISDDTRRLVGHAVEARPRPGLVFRGFDRSVDAWELTGLGQRSRWLARQASGLSPFVSRAVELADLRGRLDLARSGPCQILTIGGEPGTGKSRLVHELVGREISGAWTVWEADGEPTTSRSPFAVVRQLLRRWLGVDEASALDGVAEALRARLTSVEVPATGAAALAALLNLKVEDTTWADLDLAARGRLIEATLGAVVDAAQRDRPVLLLVEDLHWADAESRALLLELPARLPDARIAVVATHRPMEGLPERGDHVLPVALAEFSPQAAERFLDKLLGSDPSVQGIKRQLLDSTGRLPFFLEETVRHLLETGVLSGEPGACVAAAVDQRVATPRSAQAVASARVDALQPALKRLVRSASALGKRFPRALLADVTPSEPEAFSVAIRDLAQRHVFFDSADDTEDFIEFRHEFIREAAYSALMRDHRQALHRAILHAIENRYADGLRDWTAVLAHHAAQAQVWEKAVDYERKTAEEAVEASSYAMALAACNRALEHVERLPRTREAIEREIDLRLMLRATVSPESFRRWVDNTTKALELAEQIGDARRQLAASAQRAWALNFGGAPKEAIPAAEKALALAKAAGSEAAICTASLVLGQAHYVAGNFRKATETFQFPLAWLPGERRFTRHGTAGTSLVIVQMMDALAHAWMGGFEEARAMLRQAAALADETRRPYDCAMVEHVRGFIALHEHRHEEAIGEFEAALVRCREAGLHGLKPLVLTYLGAALLEARRVEDAGQILEEALALSGRQGFAAIRIAVASYLSGIRVLQNRAAEAVELAEEARRTAGELGYIAYHSIALRFLAWSVAASSAQSLPAARAMLQEAIELSVVCEARPQQAACEALAARLDGSRERLLAEDVAMGKGLALA